MMVSLFTKKFLLDIVDMMKIVVLCWNITGFTIHNCVFSIICDLSKSGYSWDVSLQVLFWPVVYGSIDNMS